MNDFNIEFAHIYADRNFGEEQKKSISRLKEVEKEILRERKSFVNVVLIDEYSPAVCTLDENTLLNALKREDASPDFVACESELSMVADKVMGLIPENYWKNRNSRTEK